MQYVDLRTELARRGFDYLTDAALGQYINDAYRIDICEAEEWPFLRSSTSGTAPLTTSDLRTVESVIDTTQGLRLMPLDTREITNYLDTDLTTTGAPVYYYLSASQTISVYPANTSDTISVRYWKVATVLSADADEPVFDSRWHSLIVDAAVARAYEDDDEWDAAQVASDRFGRRLDAMRASLLAYQHDRPDEFIVSNVWSD